MENCDLEKTDLLEVCGLVILESEGVSFFLPQLYCVEMKMMMTNTLRRELWCTSLLTYLLERVSSSGCMEYVLYYPLQALCQIWIGMGYGLFSVLVSETCTGIETGESTLVLKELARNTRLCTLYSVLRATKLKTWLQ
jgi:hypothetical protein